MKPRVIDNPNPNLKIDYSGSGNKLTFMQHKFVTAYIATNDVKEAVKEAGFSCKAEHRGQYGYGLLKNPNIKAEIAWRLENWDADKIADANEIMAYFTSVMRGEIKDAFGLDAPLSERTRAAQELAKRVIDMPNQAKGEQMTIKLTRNY